MHGFTGLKEIGPRGISEIRAILGVLAFTVLGIGYLAIAVVRAFSILFDKSYDRSNWISLAIEIVFGIILVIPGGAA